MSIGALAGHDGNGLSHSVSENLLLWDLDKVILNLIFELDDGLIDLDFVGNALLHRHFVVFHGWCIILHDLNFLGDVFCLEFHRRQAALTIERNELVTSTAVFGGLGQDRHLDRGGHGLPLRHLNWRCHSPLLLLRDGFQLVANCFRRLVNSFGLPHSACAWLFDHNGGLPGFVMGDSGVGSHVVALNGKDLSRLGCHNWNFNWSELLGWGGAFDRLTSTASVHNGECGTAPIVDRGWDRAAAAVGLLGELSQIGYLGVGDGGNSGKCNSL